MQWNTRQWLLTMMRRIMYGSWPNSFQGINGPRAVALWWFYQAKNPNRATAQWGRSNEKAPTVGYYSGAALAICLPASHKQVYLNRRNQPWKVKFCRRRVPNVPCFQGVLLLFADVEWTFCYISPGGKGAESRRLFPKAMSRRWPPVVISMSYLPMRVMVPLNWPTSTESP